MGKRIIHICDLCKKESVNNSNFESGNTKGNAELIIKGFHASSAGYNALFKGDHFEESYSLICWECSDQIRNLISKLHK